MKLLFYNHYGVGDLFESREFVRDWTRICGVDRCQYAHRSLPGFFADLPIDSVEVTHEMDMRSAVTWRSDDELWVNTWIGRGGDYVLWPGVGCVVEHLYRMHNDLLAMAGVAARLPRQVVDYLPVLDYRKFDVGGVDAFCARHHGKRLVLLCNGRTGSGHAYNFPFEPMLDALPVRDDTIYILTEFNQITDRTDVFFSNDITRRSDMPLGYYGPNDFNAISYLSRACSVIVGRCSGVQMGCQTRDNWLDYSKTLLCFTKHRNGACFVREPEKLGLKMKVVWSPAETPETAAAVIRDVLKT